MNERIDNATVKFTKWIINNKWKVIFASILVAFGLGSGGQNLKFSNNYRVFFGEENPQLQAFEEVENTYTKNDNVMFVLTPKNGNVFTGKNLAAIADLTKEAWQLPFSTRVDSITNFQHTIAKGDDLFVSDLVKDPLNKTDAELQAIKEIALSEPILHRRLVNAEATVAGVSASIQVPGKDPQEVIQVTNAAREMRTAFLKKHPDFEVRLAGVVLMNTAFAESGMKDMATLTPIMYLVMILIMALLLRSVGGTLAALGVIILSTMTAMGLAGFAGISLTPPSAIAPTIILTLAIADSVHILITMLLEMRKGRSKTDALIESVKVNMQAVFLTSITTIVGFLCLNFSDSPPYHDLGNITSMGVAAAFLYSVIFLPAFVAAIPVKTTVSQSKGTVALDRLANFVVEKRRAVLWSVAGVFIVLVSFIPKIDLDDQFVNWFDKRIEFRQDTDYMIENLTGIYTMDYSLESGEEEGISDPAFMATVDRFADYWRDHPRVIHVSTYTDIMKKLNKTMHADQEEWYKLPDDQDLASQYLLLYEMSLPFGLDLNNQMNISKSSTRLTVTFDKMSSREMRAVATEGNKWLKENAPPTMHARGTGPSVMFSYIAHRNVDSMIKGTTIAIILITILMIFALGSLKYGLISLLPNAIPAIMAFGLWSVLYGQVGMAISVVASATLGIIVDDSVHFLTKFLRAKREGLDSAGAVRYVFGNVGLALVATSLILIVGFMIMSYSAFRLNWSLGMMSAITIALALAIDFLLLPAVLMLGDKKKEKPAERSSASLSENVAVS